MVSQGKEIVIMEGLGELDKDKVSALACYTIAETLEAKVVILLSSSWALNPSKIMQICKKLGRQLLGVVINFVPESKIEAVRQKSAALFNGVGIKVLGVLPEVRSLLGVRVGELAQILGGEILTAMESTDEMIENIMLGAMTPDSGVDYFSRQPNKAAVIRGERADMQLAALETSTRCLILTNGVKPLPAVMSRAEEKHIPTILVNQDISAAIIGIEEAIANANFRSSQKLRRFAAILEGYFDFKALYSGLGLKA